MASDTSFKSNYVFLCNSNHTEKEVSVVAMETIFFIDFVFSGDMEYLSRFIRLIKHFVPAGIINPSMTGFIHGRYNMLPFDAFYDPITGEQDMNLSSLVNVVLIFIII